MTMEILKAPKPAEYHEQCLPSPLKRRLKRQFCFVFTETMSVNME